MDYFHSSSNLNSCAESSSMAENEKDKKKNGKGGSKGVQKLSTDPQSVAARERRHRISNRFKILQSLVPGGSKMDTVSMLDEAIHYVKYLKAQIWLHQNMIKFNLDDNIDDDLLSSSTVIHPSSSSVASADQEALLMYCQQQQQQPDEFFGVFQPLTPAVPLPNYSYQLGEGTMYFDGYMQ